MKELCGHLRPILDGELLQGNAVESSGRNAWGGEVKLLVLLERPFHSRWRTSLFVGYVHVHDPHYWEDEYNCRWHRHCVAAAWQTGAGCGRLPS